MQQDTMRCGMMFFFIFDITTAKHTLHSMYCEKTQHYRVKSIENYTALGLGTLIHTSGTFHSLRNALVSYQQ